MLHSQLNENVSIRFWTHCTGKNAQFTIDWIGTEIDALHYRSHTVGVQYILILLLAVACMCIQLKAAILTYKQAIYI